MSVGAANKREAAICTADEQQAEAAAAKIVGYPTAGQLVDIFRDAVGATYRIDRALVKLPVSSAYRRKLNAFVAVNARTVAPEKKLIRVFSAQPAQRRIRSSGEPYAKPLDKAVNTAQLLAAADNIPAICIQPVDTQ